MDDPKPKNLSTSIFSRLEITAISLALVSAVLYAHGTVFHRAYLESFGLSDEVFPLSVNEAMMKGFEAYSLIALRAIGKLASLRAVIVFTFFLAIAAVAIGAEWIRRRSWVRRLTDRIRGWLYYTPEEYNRVIPAPLLDFTFKLFAVFCVPLTFSIVILLATASLLAANGRYKAETFRRACDAKIAHNAALTIFAISATSVTVDYEQPGTSTPISAKGCVVAAVPEFIAIYDRPGTISIAKSRIIRIKMYP